MIIDNIEYIEKKVFIRIYTENLDVIYSEVLDSEASLSGEVGQMTGLEGMASIDGYPISVLKDNVIINSFQKIKIQIRATKNKISLIDEDTVTGSLYYFDIDNSQKMELGVYVSADTLNSIISEFKNYDAKMEIGIYANLFVLKSVWGFQEDYMLEKFLVENKSSNAILANFAIRRQIQKLHFEKEEVKQDNHPKIDNQEVIDATKKIQDLIESQKIINKNILNNTTILKWIFFGWSALFLFLIYSK